jgi:hypothetical protein
MSQPHYATSCPKVLRQWRFFGKRLLAYLFILALLSTTQVSVAGHPTNPEAASPTPQETPEPSPTPESEEIRRLREQKTRTELEKDIALAEKAKLEANFPKATATPLEGKTEVDSGVKLESEMLAYGSMSKAADQIVDEIKNKSNVTPISALAIHNDRDLKAVMGYMVIRSQLQLMEDEYNHNIKQLPAPLVGAGAGPRKFAALGAIAAAQSVLGSFIDLIALLRTDTNIKGMDFSIEESALVSEVFRALRSSAGYGADTKLFYPAVFPPNIGVDKKFIILGKVQQLYEIRERVAKLTGEIEETEKAYSETKDEIGVLQKKLKANKESIALLDKELERLQKIYWRWPSSRLAERIEEVNGQIAKLRDEIMKLPGAINDDKAQLETLDKRLIELYEEILPGVTQTETVNAINAAIAKVGPPIVAGSSENLLGRAFTAIELGFLFTEFSDATKKALIAEAETYQHRKLTDAEKERLLAPLTTAEQNALEKISAHQIANGVVISTALLAGLSDNDKSDYLTQADQFPLLSGPTQAALKKQKGDSLAKLRAINDQFDKLKVELIKVDNTAGINALTSYLQAENLLDALGCMTAAGGAGIDAAACPHSYILQLKVVRAGGNNKTTRNLLKDVFTGPSISHSGGAIAEYNLYDITGSSKSSKTLTIYSGYVKAKDIH